MAERALLVETVGRMVRDGWAAAGRKVRMRTGSDSAGPERQGPGRRGPDGDEVPIAGSDQRVRQDGAGWPGPLAARRRGWRSSAPAAPRTRSVPRPSRWHRGWRTSPDSPRPSTAGSRRCTRRSRRPARGPGQAAHRARLDELGIAPFQLLVSNLYPFEAAMSSGAPPAECVEQIDIGGPAMVRAAAKNHAHVAVITDRPSTRMRRRPWPRAGSRWSSGSGWRPRLRAHRGV